MGGRWLGYTRVSRVGARGDRLISPELQRRRIEAYAAQRGFELEMLAAELNVSGAKVSRPILDSAIERIERGEVAGIIVADLDRLSRMTLSDALRTLERIESVGGQVIAIGQNVDATTPGGRMARNVLLAAAEMQRGQYADHIAASKRQAVVRGIWPMSTVPRGYRKGDDRRLEIDPVSGPVVKRCFELRARGAPWSQIATLLRCSHGGAGKTIGNRVYLGEVRLTVGGEVVVNPTAHPALVSRALWEAAQISHPAPPRSRRGPSLLAGLIRCANCSRLMSPGDGRYRCAAHKAGGICPRSGTVEAGPAEDYVERVVLSHMADLAARGVQVSDAGTLEALEEADAELAAYQEAIVVAGVGAEHFAAGMRQRVEAVEVARVAVGRQRSLSGVDWTDAVAAYEGLDVVGRRHVLGRALGVVWCRQGRGIAIGDRLKLIAAGYEPAHLSGPGVSTPVVGVAWADLEGEIGVVEAQGLGEAASES